MLCFAVFFSAWKVVIKAFGSILMYCIVLSTGLFSNEGWIWCFGFRNPQAIGYRVPPSVDIGGAFHEPWPNPGETFLLSACFFLFDDIFLVWHFWIRFQVATWLLLTCAKRTLLWQRLWLTNPENTNTKRYQYLTKAFWFLCYPHMK